MAASENIRAFFSLVELDHSRRLPRPHNRVYCAPVKGRAKMSAEMPMLKDPRRVGIVSIIAALLTPS